MFTAGRVKDEEILSGFFAREERAIESLKKKYGRYMRTIIYRILGDVGVCEECENDVCLALWNHIPPDRPVSLKAYVAKTARNTALDRYRSDMRKKRGGDEVTVCTAELEEVADLSTEGNDLREILDEFLISLSERRRFIFLCRYFSFDSIKKIANMLEVSESTVNKEIAAIKIELSRKLKEEGYDYE